MMNLQRGMVDGSSDVNPTPGSADEQLVRMWRQGNSTDQLSFAFRLRRAIRVIPITPTSKDAALSEFDTVVRHVEEDIIREADSGDILRAWSPECNDDATCAACDFRHFCPNPANSPRNYVPSTPSAP
jgi:hypothetical protein